MFRKILLTIVFVIWAVPLFAQSVDTAWVRRYYAPGNNYNHPTAIAVDDSGNVHLTGFSVSWETLFADWITVKYHSDGDTAWVRRYNGTADSYDVPYGIALDDFGNVYVIGYCNGPLFGPGDYATIKYYPNGDTAWVRTYNGPANEKDAVRGIALDGAGNVYVTGNSKYTNTGVDWTSIKYDSNGTELWRRRYYGTADGSDVARGIATDDSGNVYVTGYVWKGSTSNDYATIKYDSSGVMIWVRYYNGPENLSDQAVAIAVDESANVYVTGASHGSQTADDYATIKYDSSGLECWVRRYNGPRNAKDAVSDIALDGSGNVYVTGASDLESPDPVNSDYTTIKYDSSGNQLWVRRYNGPDNYADFARAIAIDCFGNIYVTGASRGSETAFDFATVKYDRTGNELWAVRYNYLSSDEEPWAIAVDDSYYVYVTGFGTFARTGYLTVKYAQLFYRGDLNADGHVTICDLVYMVNYLFKNGPGPNPKSWLADVNCDDRVDIVDFVSLINYIFKGGPPPCI